MTTVKKRIPKFDSEDEEREFWATHDSADYVDWRSAERVEISKLKPSHCGYKDQTVSVTLPGSVIADLKSLARKRDMPFKSLMKIYLAERIEREMRG